MTIAKYGIPILILFNCFPVSLEGELQKYCLNIQYSLDPETNNISNALDAQFETVFFKSGKYVRQSNDVKPVLKIDISIRSIESLISDEELGTNSAAISVAYVFLPQSICYYAHSSCYLIHNQNLGKVVRAIDVEINNVYNIYYNKILDMENIYKKYLNSEMKKTVKYLDKYY